MSFTHFFKKTNQFVFLLRDSWHQSLMVRSIRPVLMRTAALPTCNTIWYGPLGAQRANASHVEAFVLAIAAPRDGRVGGCSHSFVKSQVQGSLLILKIANIDAFIAHEFASGCFKFTIKIERQKIRLPMGCQGCGVLSGLGLL